MRESPSYNCVCGQNVFLTDSPFRNDKGKIHETTLKGSNHEYLKCQLKTGKI